ncbi:MAG: TonB-dependent receptor [Opitutales bacterium]
MQKTLLSKGAAICALTSLFNATLSGENEPPVYQLDAYTVSSGPVARAVSDFASPLSIMDEAAIRREGGATLGALLSKQPGVNASSFGAGASRPIIRGFDGPRVRILDSSIESADVSDTSPDHAVAVEPLLVERVEIIRGPATLLYGSSAIGGVVNIVGKEIPRERIDSKGYKGAFEARHDTASEGESFLGYGSFGQENWVINITGLTRESEDYKIPGRGDLNDAEEPGRLENSAVETDALSVGGSWFFGERNYIGAAFSLYESLYGVPGHEHDHGHGGGGGAADDEDVMIDLRRKRFHSELVVYEPIQWIQAARIRFGYTDYEHTELEGGETGTIFERENWELRAEASHEEWVFSDEGIFGLQLSESDFNAIGDEAFTPPSTTRNQAVFLSEHIHRDRWHYEYGGRLERQTINPKGIAGDYEDLAFSLAGSVIWNFAEAQSLTLSLQRSERHPTSTELYAEGPHLATSQYELGDPDLELETAYGIDLSYRYSGKEWSGSVTAFYTLFDNYIFAENLGFETDADGNIEGSAGFDDDEALDTFQFTAVDARFWGFEAEINRLIYASGDSRLTLGVVADYVRAENRDSNDPLPRIPPLRIGLRADLESGPWTAGLLLRRAFQQDREAPEETETSGYTELSLDIERAIKLANGMRLAAFLRADNLLDEDIRHHTSFLKDVAPLPGRSAMIGARLEF